MRHIHLYLKNLTNSLKTQVFNEKNSQDTSLIFFCYEFFKLKGKEYELLNLEMSVTLGFDSSSGYLNP